MPCEDSADTVCGICPLPGTGDGVCATNRVRLNTRVSPALWAKARAVADRKGGCGPHDGLQSGRLREPGKADPPSVHAVPLDRPPRSSLCFQFLHWQRW